MNTTSASSQSMFVYRGQPREEIPQDVAHVLVDESVETISARTFENFRSLLNITVPGTVKTIGQMAFMQCTSVLEVSLGEGLADIGIMAFGGCSALGNVGIPSTVATIGRSAFAHCISLLEVELPEDSNLAAINNNLFAGCQSLRKVSLPKTIKTISERAFYECFALKEVNLCEGLISIQGFQAFAYCTSLKYLRIPKSVSSLYFCGFERCKSLASVELPHDGLLTLIGTATFQDCTTLESVIIPKSVERIGQVAFEGCTSLRNVTLHEGLVTIGNSSFSRTAVETMVIPSTVERIGDDAFNNCCSLTHVSLSPHGLTTIPDRAFVGCNSLQWFTCPKTLISIGERAFAGCSSLTDIKFNEGLETINRAAFAHCAALATVVLPLSLKTLDMLVFAECPNLMTFEIPSESKVEIGLRCFENSAGIVNISLPISTEASIAPDAFNRCALMGHNGIDALTKRYANLPVHDVCYHSSIATVEDLDLAIHSPSENFNLQDAFGLTPFHVLGAATNPRVNLLENLLRHYDAGFLKHKDNFGNAALDYLLRNTSSEALPLIQMVLQTTIVKTISRVGVDRWVSEITRLVGRTQTEDTIEAKNKNVYDSIGYFGYCMRIEVTALVELAAWKRRMRVTRDENPAIQIDRLTCRLQCGSDMVLENVLKYLWLDEESKVHIGLSLFPLCRSSERDQ